MPIWVLSQPQDSCVPTGPSLLCVSFCGQLLRVLSAECYAGIPSCQGPTCLATTHMQQLRSEKTPAVQYWCRASVLRRCTGSVVLGLMAGGTQLCNRADRGLPGLGEVHKKGGSVYGADQRTGAKKRFTCRRLQLETGRHPDEDRRTLSVWLPDASRVGKGFHAAAAHPVLIVLQHGCSREPGALVDSLGVFKFRAGLGWVRPMPTCGCSASEVLFEVANSSCAGARTSV